MPQVVVETTSTDARQAEQFLGMALVQIRAQHQANVGNFAQRADPLAGCLGKSARFEPVVGEVNPGRLRADRLFEFHNIGRGDVMLIGVVRARVKPHYRKIPGKACPAVAEQERSPRHLATDKAAWKAQPAASAVSTNLGVAAPGVMSSPRDRFLKLAPAR